MISKLKFAFLALLAAASLSTSFAGWFDDYDFKQAFTETHPFAADGKISLENVNGSVEIRTWDKNEVRIEGEKSAKTEEELKRIELTITAEPSELTIKAKLPKRTDTLFGNDTIRAAIKFVLFVPASVQLRKIETVNSGITITGVRGPVNAGTVNGGIKASGLGADTRLRTVNGSVRAEFATLAHTQTISAETVNGSTTLAFPKETGFELSARTVNGSISCAFPLKLAGKSSRHRLDGTVGGGGATLKTETVNGSIHITEL